MVRHKIYALLSNVNETIFKIKSFFQSFGYEIKILNPDEIYSLYLLWDPNHQHIHTMEEISKAHTVHGNNIYCLYQEYESGIQNSNDPNKFILLMTLEYKIQSLKIFNGNPQIPIAFISDFSDNIGYYIAKYDQHMQGIVEDVFSIDDSDVDRIINFLKEPEPLKYIFKREQPFKSEFVNFSYQNFNLSYTTESLPLRFISLMMSLESIYNIGHGEIKYRISQYCAFFLGNNYEERSKIYKDIKNLYDKRSKLVHSGKTKEITKDDVELLLIYIRKTLQKLVDYKYDKEKFRQDIEDMIMGKI